MTSRLVKLPAYEAHHLRVLIGCARVPEVRQRETPSASVGAVARGTSRAPPLGGSAVLSLYGPDRCRPAAIPQPARPCAAVAGAAQRCQRDLTQRRRAIRTPESGYDAHPVL